MSRWNRLLWPGLATLVALVILLALGTWQLQRKVAKEEMLGALTASITSQPRALDGRTLASLVVSPAGRLTVSNESVAELTRVVVTGTFIPGRSVPVRATLPSPTNARSVGGLGFFWMTPLKTDGGQIVFINRGFVPAGTDSRPPAIETPDTQQVITGLVRQPEKAQTFTPSDNPSKGEYFIRDPKVMAKAVGLGEVADLFIDAERTGTDSLTPPVGVEAREMIARIPNNHLQYAVTWFGFALTLLGVFGFFARARLKE